VHRLVIEKVPNLVLPHDPTTLRETGVDLIPDREDTDLVITPIAELSMEAPHRAAATNVDMGARHDNNSDWKFTGYMIPSDMKSSVQTAECTLFSF